MSRHRAAGCVFSGLHASLRSGSFEEGFVLFSDRAAAVKSLLKRLHQGLYCRKLHYPEEKSLSFYLAIFPLLEKEGDASFCIFFFFFRSINSMKCFFLLASSHLAMMMR